MTNIFYLVIIYPILQIIEFFYRLSHIIFDNSGISVLFVSLTVTLFSLPLYIVAEKWQQIERETVKRLKTKIDKIKKVFKGDEQYFILSTYYKQNHYHPVYALRNSLGVLIQIPFFIAAYVYLSNLDELKNSHFLFIKNLGASDALFHIGSFTVNILPIAMTLINVVASFIYSKNLEVKDKIQLYLVAGVFLVLLYNSPSGLVVYWTMNNIFSLIKNIFYKLKQPKLVLYITSTAAVVFLDIFLLFFHHGDIYNRLLMSLILLIIPALPLFIKLKNTMLQKRFFIYFTENRFLYYIFSLISLCLLLGFVIPSYVIASSPQEFSYINTVKSPFVFLYHTFFQSFGIFIFWPLCIYFLFSKKTQSILAFLLVFICFLCLVNTFCFTGSYGELSSVLTFSRAGTIKPGTSDAVINVFAMVCAIAAVFTLLLLKKREILFAALIVIISAQFAVSLSNSYTIQKEFNRYTDIIKSTGGIEKSDLSPIFHFSKEGRNIVVIMLDRAISGFIPEIFSESPDLFEKFSGFTYYPNTVSFNSHTLMGAPPLFGGYEYTPEEINKRPSESLVKKHNEALLLMPRIFLDSGFSVTVTDQPWANYSWIPDVRIYDNYPGIAAYNTKQAYTDIWLKDNDDFFTQFKDIVLRRNFIWFGFFKISPLILRDAVYKNGEYWNTDRLVTDYSLLLDNYAVLDFLPGLTDTKAASLNTFLSFVNDITHEPNFLQAPDYIPIPEVTDFGNTKYAHIINYPVNAAALKRLGTWFDYLKQNGVYDNTRIIIVSDHGADIDSGIFTDTARIPFRREIFNPLLLIKDFNAAGSLKTDESFMSNADVPALAFKDVILDPVNPFTNKKITANKSNYFNIAAVEKWEPGDHTANTFTIFNDQWYSVRDDIFLESNWSKGRK
jgi:YidC/Oxa1 family membrane protein insertase